MYKSICSGITVNLLIFDRNEREEKQISLIVYNSSFRRYLETKNVSGFPHMVVRANGAVRDIKVQGRQGSRPIGAVNQGIVSALSKARSVTRLHIRTLGSRIAPASSGKLTPLGGQTYEHTWGGSHHLASRSRS